MTPFKPLSPHFQVSDDRSTANVTFIAPTWRDHALAAILVLFFTLAVLATKPDLLIAASVIATSVAMALAFFIDDTFSLCVDKRKETLRFVKAKLGFVSRTRVARVSEAVAVHVVQDKISLKRQGLALEVEFFNDQGIYYRIRCADSLVVEARLPELEALKADLELFLDLKPNPFASNEFQRNMAKHMSSYMPQ
ncbi:hypothetical protein BC830DRAFT_1126146 [Chytriomyces sp. MP71]|nr:hypothetical protein BC830DRAFT_1126146 [Chytriomyces sp. MP71]